MKKNKLIIPIFITIIFAVTVLLIINQNNRYEKMDGKELKQLVQDYSAGKKSATTASISSDTLTVNTLENDELIYRLPKDEFFVSFAPYLTETHPCAIHNLAGCRGELANKEFAVYIEDQEGNVYVDELLTSQQNGFIDVWLPRNKDFQITISYDGKTTKTEFTTFKDDNTCITTLPLT
ncbi:CueP family metal-binding protein [Cytobacillus oceanisediminis]|uniref:CueP family metal-binding protein n=1 Tax=Bacillaceae TaxID=186817 RepID=UPI001CCDFC61|nr:MULTISPECIES: CueP family metal-binding protein [Bacillaceae]MBZ9534112.1 CueP family metal-binding protein [Cytobacillus oceanisediminis]MDU1846343.1 CueP family metal-binding protein [Niallia nealsonii]MED3793067.1 CueP family metal-binding protein [Niallia alba]